MLVSNLTTAHLMEIAVFSVNFNATDTAAFVAQCEKLANFWYEHGVQPVPLPEELVIVWRQGAVPNIPSKLISAWNAMSDYGVGTNLIGALETGSPFKGFQLKGQERILTLASVGSVGGGQLTTAAYDSTLHANVERVYADELASWYAAFLDSQLAGLTPVEWAEMFTILCPKAEAEGSVVKVTRPNQQGFVLDFESREITARETRIGQKSMMLHGSKASSLIALMGISSQLAGLPGRWVARKLNSVNNLWERDPHYGQELTSQDPTRVIMDNSCLPIKMVVRDQSNHSLSTWPWVVPSNESFRVNDMEQFMTSGKAVMVDKYAMQFVADETAANAALIGRRQIGQIDEFLTLHDAAKASKFFNRPTQARKHLKGEVEGREPSPVRVKLPDGSECRQSGRRLRTVISNSILGSGSGVSFIRPNLSLQVAISKTISGRVNFDRLPKSIREKLTLEQLKDMTLQAARKTIGKSYAPGQNIISLLNGAMVVVRNSLANQTLVVKEVKDIIDTSPADKKGFAGDSFEVTLKVELVSDDSYWKLRNDGVKLTTLPADLCWDSSFEWDIVLNNETLKGKLAILNMFVATNGGGCVEPNSMILTMDNGETHDLLAEGDYCWRGSGQEVSSIHSWVKSHTVVRKFNLRIARAEWEVISSTQDLRTVNVLQEDANWVLVEETVETLVGDLWYEVEISSPRENTGRQGFTPEMLAALALQNRNLAERLYNHSEPSRTAVYGLVEMILGGGSGDVVNITSPSGRSILQGKVGCLDGLSDRQIMDKCLAAFPKGLRLGATSSSEKGEVVMLNLDFATLAGTSTFVGGTAEGIAEDIVAVVAFAANPDDSAIDSKLYSKLKKVKLSLVSWLEGAMASKGILKKAARTSKFAISGKVRTSYHPILNHNKGELPKVVLHPDCAMVKMLATTANGGINPNYLKDGRFAPELLNGTIVGAGRVPMPMLTACEVVIDAQVGAVAHALMLPSIWARTSEGDSDGDGIMLVSLQSFGVTLQEAHEMNRSLMGMEGYSLAYGNHPSNWPYADFVSEKDKLGKKSLMNFKGSFVTLIPAAKYLAAASLVSSHYRIAVGISYGICSVLTFMTCNMSYAGNDHGLHIKALAIAWRKIYEGLGLAGYSPDAKKFFEVMAIGTWNKSYVEVNGVIAKPSKGTKEPIQDCRESLMQLLGIMHLPTEERGAIIDIVLRANKLRMVASASKAGADWIQYVKSAERDESVVLNALRELGRGVDIAGQTERDATLELVDDGGVSPESVFTRVQVRKLYTTVQCPWLAEMLSEGSKLHTTISQRLFALRQADNDEY